MKKHTLTIAAALLATLPAFGARAGIPELIPVQGVLSDGGGEFVEGPTNMVFRIYDAESATTPLWVEPQTVDVDAGFFTAYLGDVTALPVEVLGAAGELWLGVTVGADPEMDRMQLASVPFALFCENAIGDITPATISVGGNLVVNADGEWVGPGMYAAGAGLTLTGFQFAANIGTAAGTVAAGDHAHDYSAVYAPVGHDHDGEYLPGMTCVAGQVLKATVAGWECAADLDTTYTPGTALTLAGTTFNVTLGTTATSAAAGNHLHTGVYAPASHAHALLTRGTGLTGANYDGSAATTWAVSFAGTGAATTAARSDHNHAGAYWSLGGNAGTTNGTHYLGTSDNVALDFRVNNARALRIEPHATSPNIIGGHAANSATAGVYGAFIGGGGTTSTYIRVTDSYGVVAGGSNNQAGDNAGTTGDAWYATVGGGASNTASGGSSTVAGGSYNTASGGISTVAGGSSNTASGDFSMVGGGYSNTASGGSSTVAGGSHNTAAGNYSFAAGRRAKANNLGCFVWGDSTSADVTCSNDNRWVARASGGVYFYTNSTVTTGVYVAAGGGSWASVSDREKKKDIEEVDAVEVLEKVAGMPVSTWRYRTEESAALHMGPMAQDFHAAFGLGDSDKSITTIDAGGVALAAIKGLNEKLEEENAALKRRIAALESTNQDLAALSGRLEERLDRLDNGGRSRLAAASPWMLLGLLGLGGVFLVRSRRP